MTAYAYLWHIVRGIVAGGILQREREREREVLTMAEYATDAS